MFADDVYELSEFSFYRTAWNADAV